MVIIIIVYCNCSQTTQSQTHLALLAEQHCAKTIKMIRFTSNKSTFYRHHQRSVALKMRWWPGLCPGPRWGSSRRSHKPPSRLERGTPHPRTPPLGAFGASILAPAALFFQPEPYHFLKRSGAHVCNDITSVVISAAPTMSKRWTSVLTECT